MDVLMKRSTKIAPVSLSTSYFTGSAFIGISMTTLKASGTFLPGVTLSRDMGASCGWWETDDSGLTLILLSPPALSRCRVAGASQAPLIVRPLANRVSRHRARRGSNAAGALLAWRLLQAKQRAGDRRNDWQLGAHPGACLRPRRRGLRLLGPQLDPLAGCRQPPHAGDRRGDPDRRCRVPRATVQDHRHRRRHPRH